MGRKKTKTKSQLRTRQMSVVVQLSDLVHMPPSVSQYFQETEYKVVFHSWMFVFQIFDCNYRIFFLADHHTSLIVRKT